MGSSPFMPIRLLRTREGTLTGYMSRVCPCLRAPAFGQPHSTTRSTALVERCRVPAPTPRALRVRNDDAGCRTTSLPPSRRRLVRLTPSLRQWWLERFTAGEIRKLADALTPFLVLGELVHKTVPHSADVLAKQS